VQKLRDLVREERGKSKAKTTGRKPSPTVVRVLASCTRLLDNKNTGRLVLKKADFAKLTPEHGIPEFAPGDTVIVPVWDWAPGVYFLEASSNGRVLAMEKFVVTK